MRFVIPIRFEQLFDQKSLHTILVNNHGVRAYVGKLISDINGGQKVVHYIFDDDRWDKESAIKWIKEGQTMHELLLGGNDVINLSDDKGTEPMEKTKKLFTVVSKDFMDDTMSFTAIASSDSVDRDGDVLEASGWLLKNFKKNPVILWGHDANLMPIGKATNVWIEGNQLKFTTQFAPPEVNPFAKNVYEAYKQGFLTSFSVRFDPVKWEDIPASNDQIRLGRRYKSMDLLEISAVNIPANPDAHKSAGMAEFIHKSFLFEHYGKDCKDFNFNLGSIYEKADAELKAKIEKMNLLKNQKEEIINEKQRGGIESIIDKTILDLETELKKFEDEQREAKQKSEAETISYIQLKQSITDLHLGITQLLKKGAN